jgi:ribosome-binding protein aMBF1 (putative translation factor)
MKCELCFKTVTEKHHITYFPEKTIGVCGFQGDEIHRKTSKHSSLPQYTKDNSKVFYNQQKRVSRFLKKLSRRKRNKKSRR